MGEYNQRDHQRATELVANSAASAFLSAYHFQDLVKRIARALAEVRLEPRDVRRAIKEHQSDLP